MCDMELNSCSCGSSIVSVKTDSGLTLKHRGECSLCGKYSTSEATEEKAIIAWNNLNPMTYDQLLEKNDDNIWRKDGECIVYKI